MLYPVELRAQNQRLTRFYLAKSGYDVKELYTSVSLNVMQAYLAISAIFLFAVAARSGEADCNPLDEQFLRSYMAGEYDLVGRKADSTLTYTGHVTFREEGELLEVVRTVEGSTDKCLARFDTIAGSDRIPVLRMHFHFDGKEYDATYRWQSDPDNYPRFTGYLYFSGVKAPGLEALFPIHK